MITVKTFDSELAFGYKQITTFYEDFGIADHFGLSAIKDTYKRAFKEWKNDYKYLTELVLVLNWKSWEHSSDNAEMSQLYVDLFYKAQDYAYKHLKEDELTYFIRTID